MNRREYKIPAEVEELACDMFEGFGTRTWDLCTDKQYWRDRAQKLIELGWKKHG